jgi:NAD(P)-dependent dehydrogenase (short-subunit alcohol dehydrogenase family)
MTTRLDGRVAVITGGASGIGEGTVRRFVEEGARCVIADIQDGPGEALAQELGAATTFVHADVSREDETSALVDAAVAHFGRLDCMFNNAGILGAVGPIAETDGRAWLRSMDVLLNSVFFGVKHAARVMIAKGDGGTIINTTSTAGLRAGLGPHAYTTAKHGVVGLTQSVATELGRHGIRVNAIAPGATVSAMTAYVSTGDAGALDEASKRIASKVPLRRPGFPLDIANAALYLASDESGWTNGAVIVVDGGGEVIGDRNSRFFEMGAEIVQEAGRKG